MYLLTQLINRRSTIVKTKITSIVTLKVHITRTSWAVAKVNTYNVMIQMIHVRWRFRWYSCDGCYRSATKLPMSLQTLEFNFIKTHCQHAEIGKEDTRNIAYALIYVFCKYKYAVCVWVQLILQKEVHRVSNRHRLKPLYLGDKDRFAYCVYKVCSSIHRTGPAPLTMNKTLTSVKHPTTEVWPLVPYSS